MRPVAGNRGTVSWLEKGRNKDRRRLLTLELMVESLYDRIKDKISLTPLAGSDGFYRMVRWIQQDERASNLHLLRSGDLVISTEHTDVSTD